MKSVWIALAGIVAATSLSAADISGLRPGAVFQYSSSTGNSRVTYDGPDGDYFRFRYTRDDSQGSPRALTNWTDQKGRTVQVVEGDLRLRFSPHDCWLEVGECRFTVTNSDGDRFRMTQVGNMSDGQFVYELREGRKTVQRGRVTVDQYGVSVDRNYVDAEGEQHWVRRKR